MQSREIIRPEPTKKGSALNISEKTMAIDEDDFLLIFPGAENIPNFKERLKQYFSDKIESQYKLNKQDSQRFTDSEISKV